MNETFEAQLTKVEGTILRVYSDDHQHRMLHGLLYYWNKADELRKSVLILMANDGPRGVFCMLAGMAIELLLKGTAIALDNPSPNIHRLADLAAHVGIAITEDERVLLDVMTEHIYWAGRYTAPKKSADWRKVRELREQQISRSSPLGAQEIPGRQLTSGTFHQLWFKFVKYYDIAREARRESSEQHP